MSAHDRSTTCSMAVLAERRARASDSSTHLVAAVGRVRGRLLASGRGRTGHRGEVVRILRATNSRACIFTTFIPPRKSATGGGGASAASGTRRVTPPLRHRTPSSSTPSSLASAHTSRQPQLVATRNRFFCSERRTWPGAVATY